MKADEARKILSEHFSEFSEEVKSAVKFVLENWDELYCKKLYYTWQGIKKRCFKINHTSYKHYGGRGITMYSEWVDDFSAFYNYVSKLDHFGEKGYTLDRIDNNGNYEPNNLRWETPKKQMRNRQCTLTVDYQGKQMPLAEVAEILGVKYKTLLKRYEDGKRGEELFKTVRKFVPPVEYKGEVMQLYEVAKKTGIKYETLYYRYRIGKRGNDLFKLV